MNFGSQVDIFLKNLCFTDIKSESNSHCRNTFLAAEINVFFIYDIVYDTILLFEKQ